MGHYTDLKLTKKNDIFSLFKPKAYADFANHAEMNAIFNRTILSLENCVLFSTTFPCIECAKMILQSGLRKIVYMEDSRCQKQNDEGYEQTMKLFELSGIDCYKYV